MNSHTHPHLSTLCLTQCGHSSYIHILKFDDDPLLTMPSFYRSIQQSLNTCRLVVLLFFPPAHSFHTGAKFYLQRVPQRVLARGREEEESRVLTRLFQYAAYAMRDQEERRNKDSTLHCHSLLSSPQDLLYHTSPNSVPLPTRHTHTHTHTLTHASDNYDKAVCTYCLLWLIPVNSFFLQSVQLFRITHD